MTDCFVDASPNGHGLGVGPLRSNLTGACGSARANRLHEFVAGKPSSILMMPIADAQERRTRPIAVLLDRCKLTFTGWISPESGIPRVKQRAAYAQSPDFSTCCYSVVRLMSRGPAVLITLRA